MLNSPQTPVLPYSPLQGLSSAEAKARLGARGPNELPRKDKPLGFFRLFKDVIAEPMTLLLCASGSVYFVLGDKHEALMLLSFVVLLIVITLVQKYKTERSLEALKDLASPRALVVRDGCQLRIPGREVVQGDWVLLSEGDRVPADGRVMESRGLMVDESMVTGESVPVSKDPISPSLQTPDLAWHHQVFAGTLVVQGNGVFEVLKIGEHTYMGQIGVHLKTLPAEQTHLQQQTARLIGWFAWAALILPVALLLVFGLQTGDWFKGLLAGLTLAMTMIPEEFPVVMTVFMALGAWRLSRHHVLTRHIPVIETLGTITTLCVDKTGTLTQNQMQVKALVVSQGVFEVDLSQAQVLPEDFHTLLEYSILASQQTPYEPMEVAFAQLGNHFLADTEHLHNDWALVTEYPLSRELMAMSRVWQDRDNPNEYVIAAKGAPETIFDLCHLSPEQTQSWTQAIEDLATQGLRVLAVAEARFLQGQDLPAIQHDFDFRLLGLLGLHDPIRPSVPEAVKLCHGAGVRVVMMTGDYPQTAACIAQEIGLPAESVMTGEVLRKLSDAELEAAIAQTFVFARVIPQDKLRLVQTLKRLGHVVGMTGDGVNDAPALKAAHVGIAMGAKGTDVARESADLVLTDDDFTSIVFAMEQGRGVYDNLRRAVAYILAIHLPIVGLSFIPVLCHWPLMLLPVHVAFLHLIIDPAISLVFESEPIAPTVMQQPPRQAHQALLSTKAIVHSVISGASILMAVLGVYWGALCMGFSEGAARALGFSVLIVSNLTLIAWMRAATVSLKHVFDGKNRSLIWVTVIALGFLALVLFWSPAMGLFRFQTVEGGFLLAACLTGALCVALCQGGVARFFNERIL